MFESQSYVNGTLEIRELLPLDPDNAVYEDSVLGKLEVPKDFRYILSAQMPMGQFGIPVHILIPLPSCNTLEEAFTNYQEDADNYIKTLMELSQRKSQQQLVVPNQQQSKIILEDK